MSAPDPDAAMVAARVAEARRQIARLAGGREVAIVAVTKGFSAGAVRAALAAGVVDVGENYAQELVEKHAELSAGAAPRWHFLGAIQRNKVARLAPLVSCWHGVDRLLEAAAIARVSPAARLFVEVETSGRPGRGGLAPDAAAALVEELRGANLPVVGLMTVAPPLAEGRGAVEECFASVAALGRRLGLLECSMGMSDDYELAVACGSTMVRLGRALFGPR